MINKFLIIPALMFSGLAVAASAAGAAVPGDAPAAAAAPVEHLHQTLISTMKNGKQLGYRGRYDELRPVVEKSFDFPFIARLILGPAWSKLGKAQQQSLVEALAKLSISSYASEFDSYSGESFQQVSAQNLGADVLERFLFKPGSGNAIHFDYQVHRSGDHWKIANVVVDGVSDLALKRGQYRKLLSEKGFSGLIGWIKRQIADNAGKRHS